MYYTQITKTSFGTQLITMETHQFPVNALVEGMRHDILYASLRMTAESLSRILYGNQISVTNKK